MDNEKFYALIDATTALDAGALPELEAIVNEYPYFQSARLLYTKNLFATDKELYKKELGRSSILCADRQKLFYTICEEEYALFLKELREIADEPDKTQALLDSLLESFEPNDDTLMGGNPDAHIISTDYFAYLNAQGTDTNAAPHPEVEPMKHQEIIDNFIEKAATDEIFTPSDTKEHKAPQIADSESSNDTFLTETLTRVYIKQKKYDKALTIIKRLSLNFPQKSVYFADQIRFLELLIQNEKNKNK